MTEVWPVRDEGWYEVFDALRKSAHAWLGFNSKWHTLEVNCPLLTSPDLLYDVICVF